MTRQDAIRTIVIAGGGIVGLSAATAFARALPTSHITLVETLPDPASLGDVLPTTWPGGARFHGAIGVDERELVRSGIACFHLGTIFEQWSATGAPWVHAFGDYGMPAGAIPFDQIWWRAREQGEALAYDRYSVGGALARARKFVHPSTDSRSLGSRFQYGLRLDPEGYREQLSKVAIALGVTFVGCDIADIETGATGVVALHLEDRSKIQADLFIDCTGPAARLIRSIDDSFEDWSAWMPFDRILLGFRTGEDTPATADRANATAHGWKLTRSLPRRTIEAELRIGGEGTAIAQGRRLRPFYCNVLAIGDSAAALDPLHAMSLDLAQQMILLALELLPGRGFVSAETEEYNRRTEQLTRRMRDFLALHYLRSGRTDHLWSHLGTREPPDSLARTLDQYQHRGRLPFFEDERITRDSWTAALIGMGVIPLHADPESGAIPLDKAVDAMRQLAREIDETVAGIPDYGEYLSRFAA